MNLFARLSLSVALAGAALSSVPLAANAASAHFGVSPAFVASAAVPIENVTWVCGPYRCFHRRAYYGPRAYYGGPAYYYGRPRHYGYGHGYHHGFRHHNRFDRPYFGR